MNPVDSPLDDILISAQNLGKMYMLYNKPQDRLKASLFGRFGRSYGHPFWALRDVSFHVRRGETVGIIGRNGSGKSTLLQIVAGTLRPTTGMVNITGQVAALLELGSGFNPEYTGVENIFMSGLLLGLNRDEIENRMGQIIAFADIGEFIDQPVKLYSSGMAMRLAFAVQVFVPKQIFIVDEALSVGDAAFQYKCMNSLESFKQAGGTVLLVTHSPQTVVQQCDRAILLEHGELLIDGKSKPIIDLYQKLLYSEHDHHTAILEVLRQDGLEQALKYNPNKNRNMNTLPVDTPPRTLQVDHPSETNDLSQDYYVDGFDKINEEVTYGTGDAEIFDYGVYNEKGALVNILTSGHPYYWKYKARFLQDSYEVVFGMTLKTVSGLVVASFNSTSEQGKLDFVPSSAIVEVTFSLKMNVAPGDYFINAGVSSHKDENVVFLHRRVDVHMVRVMPPDTFRNMGGIAYIDPHFNCKIEANDETG